MTYYRVTTGITLISLILTIIVLLILAGVAVNMLVGEDGILSHTQTSTAKYSIEAEKEALRLEILNIQTEILKTEGRKATLEDLQARIDMAKYEIEMHYEPIATSTPVVTPSTYVIVNRKGTNYYFTVDDKLIITNVEVISITPPTVSAPVIGTNGGTPRAGRDLDLGTNYTVGEETVKYQLTWADMAEIAKGISNTLTDSDSNNDITSEVSEFNITYDGTTYLIGVGDRMRVGTGSDAKVVRIIGFNHDILSGYSETKNADNTITVNCYSNVYGGQNKYAGISFEYVDFILENLQMNSTETNENGWYACSIRQILNNESSGSIFERVRENIGEDVIKAVKKEYIKTYNDAGSVTISNDYLWLLSCGEIWENGNYGENSRGYAITKEGKQYKYYAMIDGTFNLKNNYMKKQYDVAGTDGWGIYWWLRSAYSPYGTGFCCVSSEGFCNTTYANYPYGIAPGFAI